MGIYQIDDVIHGIRIVETLENSFTNDIGFQQFDRLILCYEKSDWLDKFRDLNLSWDNLNEKIMLDGEEEYKYSIYVLHDTWSSLQGSAEGHVYRKWWSLRQDEESTKNALYPFDIAM